MTIPMKLKKPDNVYCAVIVLPGTFVPWRPCLHRFEAALFTCIWCCTEIHVLCGFMQQNVATQVAAGYVLHVGEAAEGTLRVGDTISADVDIIRRARIVPNHTFTHILNFALREVPASAIIACFMHFMLLLKLHLHPSHSTLKELNTSGYG